MMPAMKELYSITYLIKYKLSHDVCRGKNRSPAYNTDTLVLTSSLPHYEWLCSHDFGRFDYLIEFGKRAFPTAGPKLWNKLPNNIRTKNVTAFKQVMKLMQFKLDDDC